jgi:hypothetical protein
LKDYQRATAKANSALTESKQKESVGKNNEAVEKNISRVTYSSSAQPVKLSQIQHVAPKKFKNLRKKPQINLDEVRGLISKNRKKANRY